MNNTPPFKIEQGIQPEHREDAARLYAEAFAKKFEKLLGSPEEVTEILKDSINTRYAFTAVSPVNELMGLVGFYHRNSSLMDIKLKKLIKKYGFFSGLYKKFIIFILFYKKRDNSKQLLMDGIVVKQKGLGIGTELLRKLEQLALANKLTSIKLDVIDHNPAKRLYEREGFVKTSHIKNLKIIKYLIGVDGLFTMVKRLK
jgi:RimJ/RimL family protein N-acetyltransferase